MRLVFKSEYDSTEVYAIEDNNNNTLATLLNVEGDFECLGPEKSELVNMPTPQITVSL
jgi:hypothetical protein